LTVGGDDGTRAASDTTSASADTTLVTGLRSALALNGTFLPPVATYPSARGPVATLRYARHGFVDRSSSGSRPIARHSARVSLGFGPCCGVNTLTTDAHSNGAFRGARGSRLATIPIVGSTVLLTGARHEKRVAGIMEVVAGIRNSSDGLGGVKENEEQGREERGLSLLCWTEGSHFVCSSPPRSRTLSSTKKKKKNKEPGKELDAGIIL